MGIRGDPIRRSQTEDRASGQHHGVCAADQILGRQCVGFAAAGSSSSYIDAGNPSPAAEQRRHSGADGFVGGVPDAKSGDIGDQVFFGRAIHAPSEAVRR